MKATIPMVYFGLRRGALLLSAACASAMTLAADEAAEKDYFGDLPVVLSVSRLAQPLSEVPGALTVIDADTIRRSGAREVADVLRLVPGFLVTHRNGGSTVAAYHSALDIYGARMQVYVDGRSVYSSFYLGDTHRGLAAVELENIERIEVLRGSNSAAFGANAFLGVVNIVTKAPADTRGVTVAVSSGQRGIDDNFARVGWGGGWGDMRLSVSRRATTGYQTLYDDSRRSQMQLRGDFHLSPLDELSLSIGSANESFGEGFAPSACNTIFRHPITNAPLAGTCDSNKERTDTWRNGFAHIVWSRALDERAALKVSAGMDQEFNGSSFSVQQTAVHPIVGLITASAPFDTGGKALRQNFEVQRTDVWSPSLRTVVGAEVLREQMRAPFLFSSESSISAGQQRIFGGLEWKPTEKLVVNTGGLWEKHTFSGSDFAPRLSLNYHLTPEHTLRAGTTQSFRAPSIYMFRGRADFRVTFTPALLPPTTAAYIRASGQVRPESIIANEIGYLGEIRRLGLKIDVRAFSERLNKRIVFSALDFKNVPGPDIHGVEYQIDWRPFASTRILFSQAHLREEAGNTAAEHLEAPHRNYSLALFQKLPHDFDLSIIGTGATSYTWSGSGETLSPRQLDLRLAKSFLLGSTRAEAALNVQAVGGGYRDYLRSQVYTQRIFATLRLDY